MASVTEHTPYPRKLVKKIKYILSSVEFVLPNLLQGYVHHPLVPRQYQETHPLMCDSDVPGLNKGDWPQFLSTFTSIPAIVMQFLPRRSNFVTDKCYHQGLYFLQSICFAGCYHGNTSTILVKPVGTISAFLPPPITKLILFGLRNQDRSHVSTLSGGGGGGGERVAKKAAKEEHELLI